AGLVKAGRYKKVSASFYPPGSPSNPVPGKWYVRHVGFLGAHPPAVKGLAPINFADGEQFVEFSEAAHRRAASIFRRLRDWLIEKYGISTADEVIADWEIRDIEETAAWGNQPELNPAFADPQPNPETQTHESIKETDMATEEQLAAEKAARKKAEADAAQVKAELKKLQDEQEKALREGKHEQNAEFAESLVKDGRLKPADKELVIKVLDFADYPEHVDFGEGSTIGEALRQFLRGLPEVLPSGHHAKGAAPAATGGLSADFAEAANPDALSHHERAVALAAKEGITYEEAARRTAA
ncbi:2-oxoacid:acceptor oxidoreductase, partial [Neisseria sp. S1]|uniref:2-oxoacid:acceptor oxidoreductase n=1 Tax=Neisseria sp. S1 TaxID=3318354 RepID=UPI003A8BD119